jgi:hypothetical protein
MSSKNSSGRWEQPDGTRGLGGMALADLPLYGIDRIDGSASTVVVTEGEKCADALWAASVPAVGTTTGAAETPGPEALAERDVRFGDRLARPRRRRDG